MDRLAANPAGKSSKKHRTDFKGEVFKNRAASVVALLADTVKRHPDKIGFIAEDCRLTFKEFDGIVDRIAAGLASHGIGRGDHVALLLGIQMEFPLSFFALMKLGALWCRSTRDSRERSSPMK